MLLLKALVRVRFLTTSRAKASDQIRQVLKEYLLLGDTLTEEQGRRPFRVPAMRGVDEDMRDWSYYMILEHNVIVNRFMKLTVESLARNKIPQALSRVDTKKDVMPSGNPGPEQLQAFSESVESYLSMVDQLGTLRGTPRFRHPIFGMLNAHGWHCMLGLHLEVHLPQASCVVEGVSSEN